MDEEHLKFSLREVDAEGKFSNYKDFVKEWTETDEKYKDGKKSRSTLFVSRDFVL